MNRLVLVLGLLLALFPVVSVGQVAASPAAAPESAINPVVPVLAWYYPQFSQGLQTDLRNAASAKIDALIVSETGASDLRGHLAAAQGTVVGITAGVEPQMHGSADKLAQHLRSLITQDAAHPSFLRYQGKPVLIFWQPPSVPKYAGQSAQQTWQTIRDRVDPNRTSIWIAEGGDPNSTLSYLPAFDGLHLYSIAWAADPAGQLANWANRVRTYDASKLWVATVMPGGYWGSGSDPSQWQQRDRANGDYYRRTWQGAINSNPAMVILTSFNETKERTEIHPSGGWGNLYLDVTREMGDQWRSRFAPPAPSPPPAPASAFFPETQLGVHNAFFRFFDRNGGAAAFGLPISEEIGEDGVTVQYFERARFSYRPELAGTPDEVQVSFIA